MKLNIPRYPLLTWKTRLSPPRAHTGCVLDAAHRTFTTNGRMATALALQHMGIGPGDEVLLPAYHCPTMVHPVRWTGAAARFYPLQPDLSVNLDGLRERINRRTRVVVAAHFFGFPTDLRALRQLCDDRQLILIEDCAHTLFGGSKNSPIGSTGDYAIASLMKFFPVADGGCLVARRARVETIAQRWGGAGFEVKSLINALERAVAFGRLPGLSMALRPLFSAKDALWALREKARHKQPPEATGHVDAEAEALDFDHAAVQTRMSLFSRLVVHCSSHSDNIARRREAYTRMRDAFSALPGCHAVRGDLPDGVAPYVFALWLDHPDRDFLRMQQAGMPVMRWNQLSTFAGDAACTISPSLAHHVIQIPCHQGLTGRELDALILGISSAIGHPATGSPPPEPSNGSGGAGSVSTGCP